MAYFLQQLINGLTLGSIYGLIAIGYTMVYGIIGMINFAHGEIYMIGAFISIIALLVLGLAGVTYIPLALAIVLLITMFFTSIYGWAVERIAYRPLRGSFRLAPLISAIGMSIFLQNYVQITQGANVKPLPPKISGGSGPGRLHPDLRHCAHPGPDAGLLVPDQPYAPWPCAAGLRAGPQDGGAV